MSYLPTIPELSVRCISDFGGSYPAMWTTTNQQGVFCDADCTKGAHVVVPVPLRSTGWWESWRQLDIQEWYLLVTGIHFCKLRFQHGKVWCICLGVSESSNCFHVVCEQSRCPNSILSLEAWNQTTLASQAINCITYVHLYTHRFGMLTINCSKVMHTFWCLVIWCPHKCLVSGSLFVVL